MTAGFDVESLVQIRGRCGIQRDERNRRPVGVCVRHAPGGLLRRLQHRWGKSSRNLKLCADVGKALSEGISSIDKRLHRRCLTLDKEGLSRTKRTPLGARSMKAVKCAERPEM